MSQRSRDAIRIDLTPQPVGGAPPLTTGSGASPVQRSTGVTAIRRGSDGFTNVETLWSALTDSDQIATTQLELYLDKLECDGRFRKGETATLLFKLQTQLRLLSGEIDGDHPVEISTGDLLLMAHILLRHQA